MNHALWKSEIYKFMYFKCFGGQSIRCSPLDNSAEGALYNLQNLKEGAHVCEWCHDAVFSLVHT